MTYMHDHSSTGRDIQHVEQQMFVGVRLCCEKTYVCCFVYEHAYSSSH